MALTFREVVRRGQGEDERTLFLQDQLILTGIAPYDPRHNALVLGWPVAEESLLTLLQTAKDSFFSQYGIFGGFTLEFWISDNYYNRPVASSFLTAQKIIDQIRQQLFGRDVLQLVRYGVSACAVEWLFDGKSLPCQEVLIFLEEVRLQAIIPCIIGSHSNSRVRTDREILLQALSEPYQIAGASHLLRPATVIQ